MKGLAVIFMITLLLLQSCAGLFMISVFYVNRSYIANNLCENRATSMASTCAGTCVLMKKLKKERERENKNPELKFKDFQLISNLLGFETLQAPLVTIKKETSFYETNLIYLAPMLGSVFHPPLV